MLYTNLKHIEKETDFRKAIHEHENVIVICGRMDPVCIPVFRIAEELENEYSQVRFFDLESDNPESQMICGMPEVMGFTRLPVTFYYRNGQNVKVTSDIQSKEQLINFLEQVLELTAGN
jgi:thioredoxin 1